MNSDIKPSKPDSIWIEGINKGRLVKTSEILYIEANDNYCKLKLIDNEEVVDSRTLQSYEEELDPDVFFRSHKSFLVNTSYIKEYSKKGNNFKIMLNDHNTLIVARRRISEFKKFLHKKFGKRPTNAKSVILPLTK